MKVIDAQVHTYESNHKARPWVGTLAGPSEVTGNDMVKAMDAVGVDGALLVSPWSMYRYDASYAIEVHSKHPGRFGLIKPVDPYDPAVSEIIQEWFHQEGSVAIRIMMAHGASINLEDVGVDATLKAAAECSLPINLLCWGCLDQVAKLASRHPNTRLVIDHLGIKQPFERPIPDQPFLELPNLLELAIFDNITIKITGACTLSHELYPFNDIWSPLLKIFDSFGLNRCMWGTDWTRAVNILSYEDGVKSFLNTNTLSADEKIQLMGKTAQEVYDWLPG